MDNLWGSGIFLAALWLIEISNSIALRPIDAFSKPISGPLVSILIPARNEELNIQRCVNSVLFQNYADFEIIVLDDNSSGFRSTVALFSMVRNLKGTAAWKGRILTREK